MHDLGVGSLCGEVTFAGKLGCLDAMTIRNDFPAMTARVKCHGRRFMKRRLNPTAPRGGVDAINAGRSIVRLSRYFCTTKPPVDWPITFSRSATADSRFRRPSSVRPPEIDILSFFSGHRFGDGHVSSESAGRGSGAIALDALQVGDLVAVSPRYKRPQP